MRLGLTGCQWCDSLLQAVPNKLGPSPLAVHESACRANPRQRIRAAAPAPVVARHQAAPAPVAAPCGRPPPPRAAEELLLTNLAAWERAQRAFLAAVPATADGWAPYVASPARTLPTQPPALRRAWRLLGADALAWARPDPEQALTWL